MKGSRYILPVLVGTLLPSTALANAGTPLMLASMFHLLLGNLIIGRIEGLLLGWLFKFSTWKTSLVLIVANYTSAWAGGFLVAGYMASLPDITIHTIRLWFLVLVLVAFVVTLLIEFPFFWFLLRSRKHSLRSALIATPAINGITYALLVCFYCLSSETSMITQLDAVSADELKLSEPYALYYLSIEGDQVYRMDIQNPGSKERISKVAADHRNDRLFVRPRSDSTFDLYVYLASENANDGIEALVMKSFSKNAPVDWRIAEEDSDEPEGSWFNFGPVPSLANESDWEFRTGFWAGEGISGENKKKGKTVHYSLETPFARWETRNATHLAGDYLVFQLGDDQICLMHPESRKIALIARGKGPVVAKPTMSNKSDADAD